MRLILLTFILSYFSSVFAQSVSPVHLKSGDYFPVPVEKATLTAQDRFVILQFKTLPNTDTFYTQTGIRLLDYLPDNSFYAALPSNFTKEQLPQIVVGILKITPAMKTDLAAWINRSVTEIKLVYFETADIAKILKQIELSGFVVSRHYQGFQTIYIKAKQDYSSLLNIAEIYWAEPAYGKLVTNNFVERTNHRVNVIGDNSRPGKGLTGEGIKMGEWDGGDVGSHEDYNSRLTVVKKLYGISSHATHVCGTMAGAGNIEPDAKGMAPKARIYSWDFYGDITTEMDTNYKKYGYTLTQNSYAYSPSDDPCVLRGNYDATSRELDLIVEKYPNLLHVFAAGNSRGDNCRSGGFKTVNSGFQCAKNVMAVAAVTSIDGDAGFSGCGPTRDGRIKPEVSAVGVNVYSTIQGNTYQGGWNGTSMACPGASGTTALLYEYYFKKYSVLPDAHLAKNFMANSADDIGNAGPDFRHGFGRINGKRAIDLIDKKAFQLDSIKQNNTDYDTLKIPKGLHKLKIMLCWSDKAASIPAKPCLINDLDLTVIDSSGTTYKAWVLDTVSHNAIAQRGRDSLNNIEQVTIDNPPSGRLIIMVKGKRVTTSFQNYSLTWDMVNTGVTVTYPNGQESFPPPSSAGVAQTIRWDAYNLTGNAKIEYSDDKGTTWKTVVSSVSVAQKYYTWSNASDTINTNTALIKITAGSYTDMSDTTFTIYKIPSTLVGIICDSQVHFRWPKQKDAVAYKLYQLKVGEMKPVYTGTDTFFTVKALNNGVAYCFSLSSISKSGGESQRMVAKSFTPVSTVKPPRITLDLLDVAGCKNTNLVLKSTFTGTATITALWQRSNNKGTTWNTLTGRVSDTLLLNKPTFAQNAWKYRRVHYNACEGRVYTKEAIVEIDTAVPYFTVPKDTLGCIGAPFTLKIHNLKSVSKPFVNWIYNYNIIMDPFIYIKQSYEPFIKFDKLTTTQNQSTAVRAYNGCGFMGYNVIDVTVAPKLSISWKDFDTICLGKQYTLKPKITGGNTAWYKHKWAGPGVSSTKEWIFVKPDTSTLYYYTLNDGGCSVDSIKDSIYITVRPKLELFTSGDTTICAGTPALLSAWAKGGNGKYKFTWNNGLPVSKQHQVWPAKTTVYYITLSDSCSSANPVDSIVVKVLPSLKVQLGATKDTLCIGQNTTITATATGGKRKGYVFFWSNNQTDSVINVSPIVTTTYYLTFKDGCSNEIVNDSIKIKVSEPLSLKITAPNTVCSNLPFIISADATGGNAPNYKINWNRFSTSGNLKIDSTKVGIWEKAVLTDNCTSLPEIDSVWVDVYELPKIIAAKDTTLCFGQKHTFYFLNYGGKPPVNYWWELNKALIDQPIVIIEPTQQGQLNYISVIKDGCGFSQQDTTTINVLEKLDITPKSIQKCSHQDSVILFKSSGGLPALTQLTWLDGTQGFSKSFKEKASKNYAVIANDGCSDTAMFTIPVVVDEFGVNDFKIESVIDKTVTLKATVLQQTVDWDFGDGDSKNTNDTLVEKIYEDYNSYTICRKQTDRIGCTSIICKNVDVINVMKNEWFTMTISPNPNNGKFNLLFNKIPGNLKVEVVDELGKLLFSQSSLNYVGTSFDINIGSVAAGIYLLKVTMNEETVIRKIVVK
jgi:hypothetical protein